LDQAMVGAGEAVFVDDTPVNIEACEKVGMKGILFNGPEKSLSRLNQLLKIK
jgi:FMN phosphatase YigB (HAD superfamily)